MEAKVSCHGASSSNTSLTPLSLASYNPSYGGVIASKPTSSQPPMSFPQSLSSEWRALFELVTAALLVAVVYPQTQSIYQRVSQPSNEAPSFSSPDYAYAASAVLRPGQTSTLRYGEDTQELAADAVPTMLRQFQELRCVLHPRCIRTFRQC